MDVSGRKTESIPPTLAEEVAKRLFSLLIHHQDGAQIVSLVPGARLLLGRAAEADISIPEPTLSRQHCRIEVIGDEVWIEDLDSSNGTRVNGAPVQRCRLRPGDDVALGGTVTLSVHAPANHVQGLEHHARFAATLEEELMRSATLHHELAVLVVSAATGDPPYGEWCPQIRQVLRPVDRVALHSAGVVEILLPESDRGRSLQLAERILGIGQALRCGVALFPGAADDAKQLLEAALDALRQTTEGQPVVAVPPPSLWPEGRAEPELDEDPPVVGQAMQPVFETAGRVAQSDLPVLLVGETGSGKEVVAREIHSLGPRAKGPLCCVNCGGMPRDLVQSILFGHERGSFTGANQQKNGLFHEADGGTLLLDEVGELPAEAQVALLRVLETGRVIRLGSTRELPVDVRVISATHRNLEAMCEAGTFRWDLFYRLNTITLKLPPLRQRKDEIRPLAERFVARATRIGRLAPKRIDASVFAVLERYQWPGNVRELRNALERAALVSAHPVITVADLPDRVRAAVDATVCDGSGRVVMQRSDPTPCPIPPREDESPFKRKVLAYEISLIRGALQRTGWNKTAAARELQMPLRTLMHKIQVYGLSQPEEVEQSARIELDLESEEVDFKSLVRRYETKLLLDALGDCGWNKAEAARRLGLPLSTVLYKIKTYQLEDPTG